MHRPASVSSLATAHDCIKLAGAAGLILDDWQQFGIELFMGERANGSFASFENAIVCSRQNGKGGIIEARVIAGLMILGERKIVTTAHESKTNDETFARVSDLIENSDAMRRRCRKPRTANGQQSITTVDGRQTIRFIARGKGSGRGFTGDVVILDEAMMLPAEIISAIGPTMSARPNSQLFYMASAGLSTSVQLHSVRKRAMDCDPDDSRLAYMEYTAEEFRLPRSKRRPINPDDRERIAMANPAYPHRITPEKMSDNRRLLIAFPEKFIREHMCVWDPLPSEEGGAIDMDQWALTLDEESQPVKPLVFAIETTVERDYTSIGLAGLRLDGLPHIELIAREAGTDWVVGVCRQLKAAWKPDAWVIDPSSAAGSFIEPLAKVGITVLTPSAREVAQACGQIADEIEATALAVVGDVELGIEARPATGIRRTFHADLDTAVRSSKHRPLADAYAWDRKDPDIDVTSLMAVTLARWALQRIPKVIHALEQIG